MIDVLQPLIKQFMPFARERMGFKKPPKLFLKQDSGNASNPLGKTAFYDPTEMAVTLYVTNRHPKDVMRSLSHELVHHTQNCNGKFKDSGEMGEGYAQNNPHMREMERQAYELGNMCFRDWEDSIKGTIYNESLQKGANENMSTKNWKNNELKTLLTEKWGFGMDLSKLNESNTVARLRKEEALDFLEKTQDVDDDHVISWLDRGRPLLDWLHGGLHSQVAERVKALEARIPEDSPHRPGSSKQLSEVRTESDGSDPGTKPKGPYLSDCKKECQKEHKKRLDSLEDCHQDSECTRRREKAFKKMKKELDKCNKDCKGKSDIKESALFERATTICKRRHQIQGDKTVRGCIEEEMTRLMSERQDLYEKHDRDWGDKAGDEGSEATGHEHDTDYAGHGMRAGDESDTHPGKDFEHHDTEEGSDEDPKDLAGELLDLAHRFGSAVGAEPDVSDDDDDVDVEVEEEEEELDEISKRKDDPRNARAKEWPDRMREALKRNNAKLTEAQTKAIIQRAHQIYRDRKR